MQIFEYVEKGTVFEYTYFDGGNHLTVCIERIGPGFEHLVIIEWNGMEWSGVEWNGME